MYLEGKVKELITQGSYSIAEVARIVGVSYQAMHNICSGKSTPSLESLEKLANIFNVSMDIFFDREIQDSLRCENRIGHNVSGQNVMVKGDIVISEYQKEIAHLKESISAKNEIIKEKDNLIAEKERVIQLLNPKS